MKKYKLIIFDLDGTLADTSSGIIACHRFTNAQMGHPITDESLLDGIIGGPLLNTYRERFGYTDADARKAVQIYRDYYASEGYKGCVLYPGMVECLAALKANGYYLAVATLKEESLANRVLALLGIDRYFDIVCGMDAADTRTKQSLLVMCMKELNITRELTVLIGDSEHDIAGAVQAGIHFLGVSYGFGTCVHDNWIVDCSQIRDIFCRSAI